MKYKIVFALAFFVSACQFLCAQIVTTSAVFPGRNSTITITYDASQGNAALLNTSTIYAHTGLITSRSSSSTSWLYTQGIWGTADSRVLMTSIGNHKYTLTFNVANFYGDNTSDTILQMAFVFRDVTGAIVGKTAANTDIFVKMYDDSLHCAFVSPSSGSFTSAALNSTMSFLCVASQSCTMTLYSNGNQLTQVTNDSLVYNNFTFLNYGSYHFVMIADNGMQVRRDSVDVVVSPPFTQQDPPTGTAEGINYKNDSTVILCLMAPHKNFAYVLGDFEAWQLDTNYMMKRALDGERWWLQINHLTPGREYAFQYDVDGIRIGDPYCDKVLDPATDPSIPTVIYPNLLPYPTGLTTGIASVLQTAQVPYRWNDSTYHRPNKHNLVIYELLVRDFVPLHYWTRMIDSLPYLQKLGINAIELMPIMNYEGNLSWGYNPNYFCAPDKNYGVKDELKRFIDTCHQRGIAILLDIALNDAFSTCPMVKLYWDAVNQQPAANSPWFNQVAPHPYSVGYDFNHNSPYTQRFVDRVLAYWIKEYHADGYRFDLAKGYTQTYSGNDVGIWGSYDTMRIRLVERMVDQVWNNVDSQCIIIFEYFANNQEEIELQAHNKGIMLWGFDLNPAYNQCTMGYSSNSDISQVSYQYDGWSNANLVGYMESHDEERLMYNNKLYGDSITGYNVKSLDTALERMECAGALFFPVPGPKMMWQFGERGYDISINYSCRICPKPQHWEYMRVPARVHLWKVWSALIKLKLQYPTFSTTNYNVDMANPVKKIWLVSPGAGAFDAQVIGNFDVVTQQGIPYFQHAGWWFDYFSGDSINVTNTAMSISLRPGEYHLYTDTRLPLPDLSTPWASGIDEGEAYSREQISVFPIPSTGILYFVSQDNKPIEKIVIRDISGRVVYQSYNLSGSNELTVSLPADLSDGLYIYEVTVNNTGRTGKIIFDK
jgi:hypothetical protein